MIKDKAEYDTEVAALEDITSGNHTHDEFGSRIVPPNYYQLKHAAKEKLQNLQRIYAVIAASNIPWEDIVEYVESDPPTSGDQVQRHRVRAAKIRKNQAHLVQMRETRKRGKQSEG